MSNVKKCIFTHTHTHTRTHARTHVDQERGVVISKMSIQVNPKLKQTKITQNSQRAGERERGTERGTGRQADRQTEEEIGPHD